MSFSLEALAMSGANYLEYGLNVEEWEQLESKVPLHLSADDKEEDEDKDKQHKIDFGYIIPYLLWEFENQSRSISKWNIMYNLNDDDNVETNRLSFLKQQCLSRHKLRGRDNHLLHGMIIIGKNK
ncbi:hypothetical protein Adt_49238 [Abeliophyllum distichum]|uniref:Uncharacterized protein n=1 Tax=Abeliophyllum distichum TaxID=126358 RepID=A0ABD1NRR3_9LAMI